MTWQRSEIRRARQTPLKPVLEHLGYQLQPLRNGNYLLRRQAGHIVIKDNYWICREPDTVGCHEQRRAGNAIDFLVQIQGLRFAQAMDLLLSLADQPIPS